MKTGHDPPGNTSLEQFLLLLAVIGVVVYFSRARATQSPVRPSAEALRVRKPAAWSRRSVITTKQKLS